MALCSGLGTSIEVILVAFTGLALAGSWEAISVPSRKSDKDFCTTNISTSSDLRAEGRMMGGRLETSLQMATSSDESSPED
jgi:hypothetical protein